MNVTGGRRALQIVGRALAPVAVFAASYIAVVRTGVATGDPLMGPEIPALLSSLMVFGWAVADGRSQAGSSRPVQMWAAAVLVMALCLTTLFITFAAVATVSLGGELPRVDRLQLLVYGALSVAVVTFAGTVLSAAGVLIGRAWGRR